MKLGYANRKLVTGFVNQVKRFFSLTFYVLWAVFSTEKFVKVKTKKINSLLIVNSGPTVGDFYMFLGVVNRLIEKYPYLKVFFLTSEKNKRFVKNPRINIVSKERVEELVNRGCVDALVNFSPILDRGVYKKVPYTVGLDEIGFGGFFKKWPIVLCTRRVFPYEKGILKMFEAFEKLGFKINRELSFCFTEESEEYAEEFYKKYVKGGEKVVFVHAGSGKAVRSGENLVSSTEWPAERWGEVVDSLLNNYRCKVVFTGVEKEKPIIKKIIERVNNKKGVLDVSGNLSVEEEASLMRRGDLLISIDTATAHIGAQTGIPVVDLFGPFNPNKALPWTDKREILFHPEVCVDCMKDACPEGVPQCMRAITVKEVLDASEKYLK